MKKSKALDDFDAALAKAGTIQALEREASPYEALLLSIVRMGSIAAIARGLEVTPQTVNDWIYEKQQAPVIHCGRIEKLTGVSRKKLRPDIFN